jgi:hypothetical protein
VTYNYKTEEVLTVEYSTVRRNIILETNINPFPLGYAFGMLFFLYWHNSANFGQILMIQQMANVLITTLGSFLLLDLCQLAKYSSSYRCAKIGELVSKIRCNFCPSLTVQCVTMFSEVGKSAIHRIAPNLMEKKCVVVPYCEGQ